MNYRLGLDLGTTSIGWCLIELNQNNDSTGFIDWGVRIFPNGRHDKSKKPLALTRREKRSDRRRRDRYLRRRNALMNLLIENELMPKAKDERKALQTLNPYELRAKAVNEQITAYELGRVLFHINQRRGFKSNRKADASDEGSSAMKDAIKVLNETLGEQTLGEYLYDRLQNKLPARFRPDTAKGSNNFWDTYPSRAMVEDEIEKILRFQASYHPKITKEFKAKCLRIIIEQRPLKAPPVGKCRLETDQERAPLFYPEVQRFRILQEINNLEFEVYDWNIPELTQENRKAIIEQLAYAPNVKDIKTKKSELSFDKIRKKILGLKDDFVFNLETSRKSLTGDIVTKLFLDCLGEKWHDLTNDQKNEIIKTLSESETNKECQRKLTQENRLSIEEAKCCMGLKLPKGYNHFSLLAIRRLTPLMETGVHLNQAIKDLGYKLNENPENREVLPYYGEVLKDAVVGGNPDESQKDPEKHFGKISNPTVHIGLNQLRIVVNELIQEYGHPQSITVELARDLKNSQKEKIKIQKIQNKNKEENDRISKELDDLEVENNHKNRLKFKLWEDLSSQPQERCCPFTGNCICKSQLFSDAIEIEHLLPYSKTLDDSRSNKIVSFRYANRFKANRTPYEAFSKNPLGYNWNEICQRVESLPSGKKWRFLPTAIERFEENDEGLPRLLNDTRYLSKIAKRYLKEICDHVYVATGQSTALLRHKWGLNSLLSTEEKNRKDHRHHAIDAFVVANTTPAMIRNIAEKAKVLESRNPDQRHKLVDGKLVPFDGYDKKVLARAIQKIVISHKTDHGKTSKTNANTTAGRLHEDKNYSLVEKLKEGKEYRLNIRESLVKFKATKEKIETIVSEEIRKDLLHELNLSEGKDKKDWEEFLEKYSARTGVKKVKTVVEKDAKGLVEFKNKGKTYRIAIGGSNLSAEVYEIPKGKKKGKWGIEIISQFDAHQPSFIPDWRKNYPTAKLVMRLFKNDMIATTHDGVLALYRVKKFNSYGRVYARPDTIAEEKGDEMSIGLSVKKLQEKNFRKIWVSPTGKTKLPPQLFE